MKYINIIELKNFSKGSSFFLSNNENNNSNFLCLTDIKELINMVDVLSFNIDTIRLVNSDCLSEYKYLKIYTNKFKDKTELIKEFGDNVIFNLISFNHKKLKVGYEDIEFSEIIIDISLLKSLEDFNKIYNKEIFIFIHKITLDIHKIIENL